MVRLGRWLLARGAGALGEADDDADTEADRDHGWIVGRGAAAIGHGAGVAGRYGAGAGTGAGQA